MICGMAAGPFQPDRDLLTGPHDGDHHPIQQQACDPLAIGRCRRRSPPDGGQVVRQRQEFRTLLGRQVARLTAQECLIFPFELLMIVQRLLPASLQGAGDQAVLRLHGVILPGRAVLLIAGAFQPLAPQPSSRWRSRSTSSIAARLASKAAGSTAANTWPATNVSSTPPPMV